MVPCRPTGGGGDCGAGSTPGKACARRERLLDDDDPVFLNAFGTRLTDRSVRRVIDRWVDAAAVARASIRTPCGTLSPPISLRTRRRSEGHPGAAGSQLALDDAEVHPSRGRPVALGIPRRPSAGAAGAERLMAEKMAEPRRFPCTPAAPSCRGRRRLRLLLVGLTVLMLAVALGAGLRAADRSGAAGARRGAHPVDGVADERRPRSLLAGDGGRAGPERADAPPPASASRPRAPRGGG